MNKNSFERKVLKCTMALNYDKHPKIFVFYKKSLNYHCNQQKNLIFLLLLKTIRENSYFQFIVLFLQFTYVGKHSNGAWLPHRYACQFPFLSCVIRIKLFSSSFGVISYVDAKIWGLKLHGRRIMVLLSII